MVKLTDVAWIIFVLFTKMYSPICVTYIRYFHSGRNYPRTLHLTFYGNFSNANFILSSILKQSFGGDIYNFFRIVLFFYRQKYMQCCDLVSKCSFSSPRKRLKRQQRTSGALCKCEYISFFFSQISANSHILWKLSRNTNSTYVYKPST